jgi:pyruvate dehydrogenase (quinone)
VFLIASQITTDEQSFDFPQEVDFAPIYKSCSVTDENSFYWT